MSDPFKNERAENEHDQMKARIALLEHRLATLEYCQQTFDAHIAAVESSMVFRFLRGVGRPFLEGKAKLHQWLVRSGFDGLSRRLAPKTADYASWVEQEAWQDCPPLETFPRFSILIPAHQPRRELLEETIASVRAQTYAEWEICLCHDDPAEAWLLESLKDSRIQITSVPRDSTISARLTQAASLATGDYFLVLDQDARLSPAALHWIASAAPADLIYTDEDHFDAESRRDPVFKPGWSPDLLLSSMYLGRSMAFSREAWERSGKFCPARDSAWDFDLALRITDLPAVVRHVPVILYHSPAAAEAQSRDAYKTAARESVRAALDRRRRPADVEDGIRPGSLQARWKIDGAPLASLIFCSKSPQLLEKCLQAIAANTAYTERELIVVLHHGRHDAELQTVIERFGATQVPYAGSFQFPTMNRLGAAAAKGEILVFLNDDVEPLEPSWLERLVAQAQRPDVGVVGARLLYPSGTLQHAGVAIGIGDGCAHVGRGVLVSQYWPWLQLTRDVAAVTGACMAIRASLFRQLGGFDDEFPSNYNDIDLCLRARREGFRVVYDSAAVLRHYESQTRRGGVTLRERMRWFNRWGQYMHEGDPFYNPHLTQHREDLSLRSRPGV